MTDNKTPSLDIPKFMKYVEDKLLEAKLEVNPVIVNIVIDEILKKHNIAHELVIGFKCFESTKKMIFYTWIVIGDVMWDVSFSATLRVDPEIAKAKIVNTKGMPKDYERTDLDTAEKIESYKHIVKILADYVKGQDIWKNAPDNISLWRKSIQSFTVTKS